MWNQGVGGEGGRVSWHQLVLPPPPPPLITSSHQSSRASVWLNPWVYFGFCKLFIRALQIQNKRMTWPCLLYSIENDNDFKNDSNNNHLVFNLHLPNNLQKSFTRAKVLSTWANASGSDGRFHATFQPCPTAFEVLRLGRAPFAILFGLARIKQQRTSPAQNIYRRGSCSWTRSSASGYTLSQFLAEEHCQHSRWALLSCVTPNNVMNGIFYWKNMLSAG